MAILCLEDPRLQYIAFLEEDSGHWQHHLAADPLFSFLFTATSRQRPPRRQPERAVHPAERPSPYC